MEIMFSPFISPFDLVPTEVPLLREAFPDWKIGYGIFEALEQVATMPWNGQADSESLDIEYFGNHSGGKFVAPVVMHMIDSESLELTETDRVALARIIWMKFKEPWTHLWETNVAAYNPIHNYDMTDMRTLVRGDTEASDSINSSVDSTDHGRTNDTEDYVYGMNSDQDGPGRKDTRTYSEEGGETSSVSSSVDEGNRKKDTEEVETTLRSGNIGVTTTQQMLKSEREIWLWNFFDQVYKDIDTVLSLPIYDACRI